MAVISPRELSRSCRYYLRALKHSPKKEYAAIIVVLTTGAWGWSAWTAHATDSAIPIGTTIVGSAFMSLISVGFVAALRRTIEATSAYNLSVAVAAWQRGDGDHAFLILFDSPRLLSPNLVKQVDTQRLLRAALSAAVEKTAVTEVRNAPAVVRLLGRLPEGEYIVSASAAENVRINATQGQSTLRFVLILAVVSNALL